MMEKLIGVAVPNTHIPHTQKGGLGKQEHQNNDQQFLKSP
jgi:hypothetical protein